MAHGQFSIRISGDTVISKVIGITDSILMRQYCQELKDQLVEHALKKWANLVFVEEWELNPKEAEQDLRNAHLWAIKNGRKCLAMVLGEQNQGIKYHLLKGYIDHFPAEEESYLCANRQQAVKWLQERGYALLLQATE